MLPGSERVFEESMSGTRTDRSLPLLWNSPASVMRWLPDVALVPCGEQRVAEQAVLVTGQPTLLSAVSQLDDAMRQVVDP